MKKLIITLIIFQFTFSFAQDPLTPCQQAQLNATGLIGEFVPQCEDDGSYSLTQCWGSTGYCWCVDEDGQEILGTSIPSWEGIPNCSLNINACTLIPDPGICFAAIQMYYFNQETQQCEDFTWGGCAGVVPFESLAECEAALCGETEENCCINPAWINPNAMCGMIWAPVIGCDGIEYDNSCIAEAAGITSWVDQFDSETILNWDCGGNQITLCTSLSGIEIMEAGFWQNPNDPCEMGECTPTGDFIQIVIDCAEDMGLPCAGEWVEVEGQCCSECIEDSDCIDQDTIMNSIFSGGMSISSCSEAINYLIANYGYSFENACSWDGTPMFNFDGFILSDYCECTCTEIETHLSYCDSIILNPILPLAEVWDDSVLFVSIQTYFSNYSIPDAGLILIDDIGNTIAVETVSSADNIYAIGPNISETRHLLFVDDLVFPFEGELCVVESLFAGTPNIVCSYPVIWEMTFRVNNIENKITPKLIKMFDVMGREQYFHQSGQLLFYLYDNGEVVKKSRY